MSRHGPSDTSAPHAIPYLTANADLNNEVCAIPRTEDSTHQVQPGVFEEVISKSDCHGNRTSETGAAEEGIQPMKRSMSDGSQTPKSANKTCMTSTKPASHPIVQERSDATSLYHNEHAPPFSLRPQAQYTSDNPQVKLEPIYCDPVIAFVTLQGELIAQIK
jgi:hypothetical protein